MKNFYGQPGPVLLPAGIRVPSEASVRVPIRGPADIVAARKNGRELSEEIGASETDTTFVGTMISELARNIVLYAASGYVDLHQVLSGGRRGISITAVDDGPGIADLQRALLGGYSTAGRPGLGLCGVRRMADEFDVHSVPGGGTTVTASRWFR